MAFGNSFYFSFEITFKSKVLLHPKLRVLILCEFLCNFGGNRSRVCEYLVFVKLQERIEA